MIRLTPDIQTRDPERNWGRIHPAITAAMVEASESLDPRRPGAPTGAVAAAPTLAPRARC